MPPNLAEAEVVYWLKRSLLDAGLQGRQVRQVLVDSDASYLRSPFRRQLEPTGTIWIGSWRPDLVCVLNDNQVERVVGFEVKASADHEKGVVQASRYRDGVHEAYLCVPRIDAQLPSWLTEQAVQGGIGIVRASPHALDIEIQPARPRPDPRILLATQRYLLGETGVRSLGLNKPLHYVAVLVAYMSHDDPWKALEEQWGIQGSAIRHAFRGAQTLGLLSADGQVTTRGRACGTLLMSLGFDFVKARRLTRLRLVDHEPRFAALLRMVLIEQPAVDLILQALIRCDGGPVTVEALAVQAHNIDEGMANAVFGTPQKPGEGWYIRPSTSFVMKAAMYDVGLIDSPLAKGASGPQQPGGYEPRRDFWSVGRPIDGRQAG